MTTLTLTPAATFRSLHRQQGDVTLAIAVAGAMRARHRILGDVTLSLLVDGAMRHSYVDDAIEGDYYRYFGGAPSFGSSVYDDTWDGGPPNIWGGVSFSYAENTPIFSFGNLFFAAGQGENEMIAERTRLVSEGLECTEVSWAALDWEFEVDWAPGATLGLVDSSVKFAGAIGGWSPAEGVAEYLKTDLIEEDIEYKARLTFLGTDPTLFTFETTLFIDTSGLALGANTIGGIGIEYQASSDAQRDITVRSYNAAGAWVNSTLGNQIAAKMTPGVPFSVVLRVKMVDGLLYVWEDDVLKIDGWDPGAYDVVGRKFGFWFWTEQQYAAGTTREVTVSELSVCKEEQNIVTALEMYPIRTVLERIGLPVMRFDRQGQGKVEPNKIKFVRGLYPIIDAPPGTRLLISIGSQDKVNDAVAWEGPFEFIVGTDYFVDFRNSGRYVSIRFESVGQPPWQLLGYDLDVEILGER